ncbi:MAG: hypothetical protein FWD57_17040, partial [Polyangiaceae bacterium]|nr:hypothetical protein [Polyangiaceae bacterium]
MIARVARRDRELSSTGQAAPVSLSTRLFAVVSAALTTTFPAKLLTSSFAIVTVAMVVGVLGSSPAAAEDDPSSPVHMVSSPEDLGDFIGGEIVEIEVVQTGRWRSDATIRSVRIGERMTPGVVRRAARELLSGGGFAGVSAFVESRGDGVKLRLEAVPRRLLASRRVTGSPLDSSEIWRVLGIDDSSELTEAVLDD